MSAMELARASAIQYPSLAQDTTFWQRTTQALYDIMDPFGVLAAASPVNCAIKLGTGVLLVQQRDTIQTAKLVASSTR
jgi:hypothetical protein